MPRLACQFGMGMHAPRACPAAAWICCKLPLQLPLPPPAPQTVIDAPNSKKSDLRRARSAMLNLAPTSTGSATAIALIFPGAPPLLRRSLSHRTAPRQPGGHECNQARRLEPIQVCCWGGGG